MDYVALRKESVDRNLKRDAPPSQNPWSLSARRAWIEISGSTKPKARRAVALRKESVDRNSCIVHIIGHIYTVALRKESVDRNTPGTDTSAGQNRSLSARRAWIEIRI